MASDDISPSTNKNISSFCRFLWEKTITDAVFLNMPLYAAMFDRKKIITNDANTRLLPTAFANMDSLYQAYTENEALDSGRKTTVDTPWFDWKMAQVPLKFTVSEWLKNGGEGKVIDFASWLVKRGTVGMRRGLYTAMYASAATDAGANVQSLIQALNHDATYLHTSRATTATNAWWQSASVAGTYADQDTQRTASVATVRDATVACMEHADSAGRLIILVGPAIWKKLKSQVDGSKIDTGKGPLAQYGFKTFTIDDTEVVMDYWLTAANLSSETTPQRWMFCLNVDDWELRFHPERKVTVRPFVYQGDIDGGTDSWLGRVMLAGNLVCRNPGRSLWFSDVR